MSSQNFVTRLHNWFRGPRRPARARKNRVQLGIESLEERAVPVVGLTDALPEYPVGRGFDGVVQIRSAVDTTQTMCSGSLMSSGRHVLTASHCLTDGNGNIDISSLSVDFDMPTGRITFDVPISEGTLIRHPNWNGRVGDGNDLALIQLPALAPAAAERYDIYRDTNEGGQLFSAVGYGLSGNGTDGAAGATGTKRRGYNSFESVSASDDLLQYDFDRNDHGFPVSGDSGSPVFIGGQIAGGQIAGVHSFRRQGSSDPNVVGDFGEIGFSARISSFANWIDDTISGSYDLVVDMNRQMAGNDGKADHIEVSTGPDSRFTVITINGRQAHMDRTGNIRSIVIRGSADDDTITLSKGFSVLGHTITVDGRLGSNELRVEAQDLLGERFDLDISGLHMKNFSSPNTVFRTNEIDMVGMQKLTIIGGRDGNIIHVSSVPLDIRALVVDGGAGSDQIYVNGNLPDFVSLIGGDGHDQITVDANVRVGVLLDGGAGNDVLQGGAGNDNIQGGADNDTIIAGRGRNVVSGGTGIDTIREFADTDFEITAHEVFGPGHTSFVGIEKADIQGGPSANRIDASAAPFGVWLYGNDGDDVLIGSAFDDVLRGSGGHDILSGGQGSDQLYGDEDWQRRPGKGTDIGVGADGSAWVVGTGQVEGGFGIFRWTGNDWQQVHGGAVRIAVGPEGDPWVISSSGNIYHWNGTDWTRLPGLANDIGVGADGSLWIIGTHPVSGGFEIHRRTENGWHKVHGGAVRIAVDAEGNPWVVNDAGRIYRWTGNDWERLHGFATDIGVGADGSVWIAGRNGSSSSQAIFRWTGSDWQQTAGGATQLAVGPDGLPWMVNHKGNIYQMGAPGSRDGNDVLLGGGDDDLLIGTDGRDILVGGAGTDQMHGGAADDILITGATAYENETSAALTAEHEAAWKSIMSEWTADRDFASRMANLEDVNRDAYLSNRGGMATVFAEADDDVLHDSLGENWVFTILATTELQVSHGFQTSGNLYVNWAGFQEKWFQSRDGNWYFLTSDGGLYESTGSADLLGNTFLGQVDRLVYTDLSLLFDAQSSAELQDASDLQASHSFRTTGNVYFNYQGWEEKWFQDQNGTWYYLTASGRLYQGDRTLIAQVDALVYKDLTLLFDPDAKAQTVEPQTTKALQETHGFYTAGNLYYNYSGLEEKWFQDNNNTWHYMTPSGRLYTGNGTLLAEVDAAVYKDLTLLFDADANVKVKSAKELQTEHGFYTSGNLYFNYSGFEEKWFQDKNDAWYYITSSGRLYDGDGTLLAQVNAAIYEDLSLLFEAAVIDATDEDSLQELQDSFGFHFQDDYYLNSYGQNEKWFMDSNDQWYLLTPDGKLYRWNGKDFAGSTLLARVAIDVYTDPTRLFTASSSAERFVVTAVETAQDSLGRPAAESFVGMDLETARNILKQQEFGLRVAQQDGEILVGTLDLKWNRLDVGVTDGLVVFANWPALAIIDTMPITT